MLVLDKDPSKDKFMQRSIEGVFVGYPRNRKSFRVLISSTRQIIEACDVKFIEEARRVAHDMSETDDLLTSIKEAGESKRSTPYIEFSPPKKINADRKNH